MKSEFEKLQSQKILDCYGNNDLEKGGKRAFVGERRTHSDGEEWIKTASGWVRVKEYKEPKNDAENNNSSSKIDSSSTPNEGKPVNNYKKTVDKFKEKVAEAEKNDKETSTENKNEEKSKVDTESETKKETATPDKAGFVPQTKTEEVKKVDRKVEESTTKLIRGEEGLKLNAYQDDADVWTIGYGSTYHKDGTKVKKGDKLKDKAEALDLFNNTLKKYVAAVKKKAKVPLTQNQFDALVSFTYNNGEYSGKTVFEKLNNKDYEGAADAMLVWNKITVKDKKTGEKKKVEAPGLTTRRKKEKALFLKPD